VKVDAVGGGRRRQLEETGRRRSWESRKMQEVEEGE
jgi:hypothetical protein